MSGGGYSIEVHASNPAASQTANFGRGIDRSTLSKDEPAFNEEASSEFEKLNAEIAKSIAALKEMSQKHNLIDGLYDPESAKRHNKAALAAITNQTNSLPVSGTHTANRKNDRKTPKLQVMQTKESSNTKGKKKTTESLASR